MTAKKAPTETQYIVLDLNTYESDVLSREELFLRADNWICDHGSQGSDEAYLDMINDQWVVFEVKPNLSISRVMITVETPARKYFVMTY